MTRLKTICLCVAACMLFSMHHTYAQSNSCISNLNVSVGTDCQFVLTPEMLRATGDAGTAGSITFDAGTGSTTAFIGGQAMSSIAGLGFPEGGAVGYELYASDDGTGPMLCWGQINFEVKNVPDPITRTLEVMCSQPIPDLPTAAEVAAQISGLCIAPITDFTLTQDVTGESCSGFTTIRTISGTIDYGNTKVTTPLRIDTIIETPLTVDMVFGPLGGPRKDSAIILTCDDIGDAYPTPEIVEEFSAEGAQGAYPYIPKGLDTTITFRDTIVQLQDTVQDMQLVVDDSGNELWVVVDVIRKTDTLIQIADTTVQDIVLVLRDQAVCNLGLTYKDDVFPGCAGPDSKILRTWNVLDWCTGDIDTFFHWIVIETNGPIIEPIDDAFAAIEPWVCTASYQLNAVVDQGCSETLQLIWETSIGFIEDNKVLTGLWPGEVATVKVTAVDDCGQRSSETFTVTPIDSIAPVAIAEDQVNVSLSGDPLVVETDEDRGVAKVFVDAIDAGSHNSGCGEVDRCVLLKEELEDPVIIGGVHAQVDGKLIYHAKGCLSDGVIPGRPATKNEPGTAEIHYVYCKEYVKFCCESVGFNNVAMIVTNTSDAESRTWTQVLVEDKTSPIVICPQGFTVGCNEEFEVPQPTIFNGVCSIDELEMTMTEDFDNCGDGTKTVIWTRNGDVICTIEITVDGESGFDPYEIKWPKHYNNDDLEGVRRECEVLTDDDGIPVLDDAGNEQFIIVEYDELIPLGDPFECTEGGSTGEPTWCNNACGLVGVNFEDQNLAGITACRKIVRRWTIVDWCSWDANEANIDDDNDATDAFTLVNDAWLGEGEYLTDSRSTAGVACTLCDKPSGAQDSVYFRYDVVDVDGYYTFDQVIKILDFDEPEVTAPDTIVLSIVGGATAKGDDFDECFASDIVPASAIDLCGGTEIDASDASWFIEVYRLEGDGPVLLNTKDAFGTTAQMNTQVGMTGDVHLIKWNVRDGCGNIGSTETYVIFVEDKKPTPICIATLSTTTMNTDGTSTIWAADFDAGSFDNCSTVDLLFRDQAGNFTPSLTFECDDLVAGINETFSLELYAVDQLGNYDFCNVDLRVDDFNNNCPDEDSADGASLVSGSVSTIMGDMVEHVEVSLDYGPNYMTAANGGYVFRDLAAEDFDITASRDDDHVNGVTALDLVLLQRHLLGISQLDDPYKVIAADINNDGRVSALDLVDMRKLLLGITEEFPSNNSWRFVVANQDFANPNSPFPFTEVISIRDFDGQERSQNFMAIKIGDLNTNAVANSLDRSSNRSLGRLSFVLDNKQVSKGQVIEVAVKADDFDEIMAYQFTLALEGLELLDVVSGAIDVEEQMIARHDGGLVTMTWTKPEGVTSDEVLYTLQLKGSTDIWVSEAITISSDMREAIAYNVDQESLDINIAFDNDQAAGLALRQNRPNPFDQFTNIEFDIPHAGQAELNVYDVTGQLVYQSAATYTKGSHVIRLDKTELQRAGVLYYQLDFVSDLTGDQLSTGVKKMIVLR